MQSLVKTAVHNTLAADAPNVPGFDLSAPLLRIVAEYVEPETDEEVSAVGFGCCFFFVYLNKRRLLFWLGYVSFCGVEGSDWFVLSHSNLVLLLASLKWRHIVFLLCFLAVPGVRSPFA